jgi:hypothetical protein
VIPRRLFSLSDEELSIVMCSAALVPVIRRFEFLNDVAAELARFDAVGPALVDRVCHAVQRRHAPRKSRSA